MNQIVISSILIMGFIIIYAFLIQIYTVLFRITGITKEKARFQVISLLTSCGYTTSESEIVTDDKLRRKIAKAAMITGYAFSVIIVSLIINLLMNLNGETQAETFLIILAAFAIFVFILILFKLPVVNKNFEKLVEYIATNIMKRGDNDNVITQLDNYGSDAICEVIINKLPDFLAHTSLFDSKIKDKYRINVLILKRKGRVVNVDKDTIIQKSDHIVVFGNYQLIKDAFRIDSSMIEEIVEIESKQNVLDIIDNYGTDAMVEIKINKLPSFMKNKSLIENPLRKNYNINVMMIKRNHKIIEINKDTIIMEKDSIVVFGPYINIKSVFLNTEE